MEQTWRKKALDLILIAVLAMGSYLLLRRLFFLLVPIFLALIFSEMIRKSLTRLRPLSEGVKRILIVLVLLIFFALLSLLVILLTERFLHTISDLSTKISAETEKISSFFRDTVHSAEDMISRFLKRDMENSLAAHLPALFQQFLERLISALPGLVGKIVEQVPRFFISLLIFVVATYYFSCDWNLIYAFFKNKIKAENRRKLQKTKERFFQGLRQYTKAYLLLFLLTFSELFLGLTLLKVEGAGAKAAVIALVDLLPIFGCGTVLVPWILVAFLLKRTGFALGLLALYLLIFAIRQLAEPKIVGDAIGIHPLLSLILVISGLALFGFFGMLLLPLLAACLAEQPEKQKKKGP